MQGVVWFSVILCKILIPNSIINLGENVPKIPNGTYFDTACQRILDLRTFAIQRRMHLNHLKCQDFLKGEVFMLTHMTIIRAYSSSEAGEIENDDGIQRSRSRSLRGSNWSIRSNFGSSIGSNLGAAGRERIRSIFNLAYNKKVRNWFFEWQQPRSFQMCRRDPYHIIWKLIYTTIT